MRKNDLILVTDMQNVYLPQQPWACVDMDQTIRNIIMIIEKAEKTGARVIFTEFMPPEDKGTWSFYNRINRKINEDAWMNEMIDKLKPYAQRHPVYQKRVYSSLSVPQIKEACRQTIKTDGRVVLCGVVDDCCVLSTFFAAVDEGCRIVWIADGCAGITEEKHRGAEGVVRGLAYCHCSILDAKDYIGE